MRVPIEWLKEYVAIRLTPTALAERLTMAGLEVVAIHDSETGPVLEMEITPNRPDWLSMVGVAREVAAITGQRLKPRQATDYRRQTSGKRQPGSSIKIRIEDKKGCRRYIGRLMEDVKVGPSPEWMQRRLLACGARPINNLVDITNYVLFETGQPLHAFDFDRLAGGEITVRRARAHEPITTLDGIKRALPPETLVIADAKRPVAVAGVMGGVGSEVIPQTRTVLLESALFDPITVRRTARRLGVSSESSYRFERGVDPAGVDAASQRAAALIHELAGGSVSQAADVGVKTASRATIAVDLARVRRRLGITVTPAQARTTLARLGCLVASSGSGETLRVTAPTFRRDLLLDVDIDEELARSAGYERLPSHAPSMTMAVPAPALFWRRHELKTACAGLGLTEAISWSLVSEQDLLRIGAAAPQAARVANPLSQEHAYLRPSLLTGLLAALRRNLTQGAGGVRLFELGHVVPAGSGAEREKLGVIIAGAWSRDWASKERASDFFLLKGLLQALAPPVSGRAGLVMTPQPHPWADPSQSVSWGLVPPPGASPEANIGPAGRATGGGMGRAGSGVAGKISPHLLDALDVKHDAWFAECDAELLWTAGPQRPITAPTPFPQVKRDLSLLLDRAVTCETVFRLIRDTGGAQARLVELIDRYEGRTLPQGKHGLTFSIAYQDPSRTLNAAEVDALHQRIGRRLAQDIGAAVR